MELLVFAQDHDEYEAGDILDVRPDGFEWGYEEMADQLFEIIHVPDDEMEGSVEAARALYCTGVMGPPEPRTPDLPDDAHPFTPVLKHQKWKVTPAGLLREKWINPAGEVLERPVKSLTRTVPEKPVKRRTGPRVRPPLPGEAGGPGSAPNPRAQGRP